MASSATSVPIQLPQVSDAESALYDSQLDEADIQFLLEQTGSTNRDELKRHLFAVREEAYAVSNY